PKRPQVPPRIRTRSHLGFLQDRSLPPELLRCRRPVGPSGSQGRGRCRREPLLAGSASFSGLAKIASGRLRAEPIYSGGRWLKQQQKRKFTDFATKQRALLLFNLKTGEGRTADVKEENYRDVADYLRQFGCNTHESEVSEAAAILQKVLGRRLEVQK